MDPTAFKQSLDDLMVTFYKRMESFEGKLQNTPATSNTEALTTEFNTFKSFVARSLRTLQEQIELLAKQTDHLEMRSRRKILLFYGLAEDTNEATDAVISKAVVEQLKVTPFSVADISRCHRMGRPGSPDKPRPILCKLKDVALRDKIWASKTSLKGTGVTISEFLTKARHTVFMSARQRFGVSKCWTRAGYVYVLGSDGSRHRVSSPTDLDDIAKEVPAPQRNVKKTTVIAAAPAKQKRAVARK